MQLSIDCEANCADELLQHDSISPVKTIHIQTHKLSFDKGKLRPSDAEFFESSRKPRLLCSQEPEKSVSFKVVYSKRLDDGLDASRKNGTKSPKWRDELNDKDSYDILKNIRTNTKLSSIKTNSAKKVCREMPNLLPEEDFEYEEQILDKILNQSKILKS